jgi:hypothetical protein
MESLAVGKYINLESCIYNENNDAINVYTTLQIYQETKAFTLYSEYGFRLQPSVEYKGLANYDVPNVLQLDFKQMEVDPLDHRNETQRLDYTKMYGYEICDLRNGKKKVIFNPPVVNDVGIFYWPEDEKIPARFIHIDSELLEQ